MEDNESYMKFSRQRFMRLLHSGDNVGHEGKAPEQLSRGERMSGRHPVGHPERDQ